MPSVAALPWSAFRAPSTARPRPKPVPRASSSDEPVRAPQASSSGGPAPADWRARFRSRFSPAPSEGPRPVAFGSAGKTGLADAPFTRALGVDFGTVRTGLAFSVQGFAPRAIEVVPTRSLGWAKAARRVVEAAKALGADGIVVGLPVTSRGDITDESSDSEQGKRCRSFADMVAAQGERERAGKGSSPQPHSRATRPPPCGYFRNVYVI